MKKSDAHILELKSFLDEKVDKYNRREFVTDDPVSIPHRYSKRQDIEIAGLFAAVLAWGQRVTIIRKTSELLAAMDDSPHEFILHHSTAELKPLKTFRHRTFNGEDALYFVKFLSHFYKTNNSLEAAFPEGAGMKERLEAFRDTFFSIPHPRRTVKHISTPARKSACKRLNMFLRWMVRQDNCGVDFGIWRTISPSELICPIDLHVERVARKLKLIRRTTLNWETAEELTNNLRLLDPADPVKYDFALFGLGIEEKF